MNIRFSLSLSLSLVLLLLGCVCVYDWLPVWLVIESYSMYGRCDHLPIKRMCERVQGKWSRISTTRPIGMSFRLLWMCLWHIFLSSCFVLSISLSRSLSMMLQPKHSSYPNPCTPITCVMLMKWTHIVPSKIYEIDNKFDEYAFVNTVWPNHRVCLALNGLSHWFTNRIDWNFVLIHREIHRKP